MNKLNLDTAGVLDIELNEGHSFNIVIDHFEADGTTPLPLTGAPRMGIRPRSRVGQLITIENTNGINAVGNRLQIDRTVLENTLAAGEYDYDIRLDMAETSLRLWKGIITVNKVHAKAI